MIHFRSSIGSLHSPSTRLRYCILYLALAALAITGDDLAEIGLRDGENLNCEDADEDDRHSNLQCEDLGVGLHEADAGGPVKGLPRVGHADDTGAAHDLRHDLSAEAPIEGDDGLVGIVKEPRLARG